MSLPDLSNSMYVAQLRHIQSIHESPERRNPDTLVRHFLPKLRRLRTALLGETTLSKLRADPFYYYLLARTKYYDQVLNAAVCSGAQQLISVGCGSDTRAYRFQNLLCGKGVGVLECDQPEAIRAKQLHVSSWLHSNHVEYLPIDLNDGVWPNLERWLGDRTLPTTLVLMEGVSPYIHEAAFSRFLLFLAAKLPAGSSLAYDFKVWGVNDAFGHGGRTEKPFRLSSSLDDVSAFHRSHGFRLEHLELSSELWARLLPGFDKSPYAPFTEDALVQLRLGG